MIRRNKSGFTLIELLVVIAIIAILAAILFPVFAKARDKARQAACLSNVKQLSMGIVMYAQDYDQQYPPFSNWLEGQPCPGGDPGLDESWADRNWWLWPWQLLVYPYTKSTQVARCPNHPAQFMSVGWYEYSANEAMLGSPGGAYGYYTINDSQVQSPASKVLVVDGGCYGICWNEVVHPYDCHYIPGQGPYESQLSPWGTVDDQGSGEYMNGRHSGGVIVGFADGHASWKKADVLVMSAIASRDGDTTKDRMWDPKVESK